MKRDPNIIFLSRDHHYGLLFCWKIRQGLARHIDLDRIRKYVLHFWKSNLKQHFAEEEDLLFRGRADALCLEAMEQHERIGRLVEMIGGAGAWIEANYRNLADQVDQHIRFEERQVFPHLEKTLTGEELTAIGQQLDQRHTQPADDLYIDAFWNAGPSRSAD